MTFPAPVIEVAIEPRRRPTRRSWAPRSRSSPKRIPTFRTEQNQETGQTIIKGMGELHLDILVDRMKREFNVEANVGKPQVAYRETIRKTVEKYDYTHKKQTGGSGQFAKVQITIEPLEVTPETTYEFVNGRHRWPRSARVHRLGRPRHPGRDAGRRARRLPDVGVKATLVDGAAHDVDSSEMAFKIAGSMAYKRPRARRAPFCSSR
jgi:elongation factor G